jgi:ribosomal protein L32
MREFTPEQRRSRMLFRIKVRMAKECPVCGAATGKHCVRKNGFRRRSVHRACYQ